MGHDLVREHRADALDQAGAQVAADALDRRGQDRRVVVDVELLAVLRVRAPVAAHADGLARLGAEQRADDRDQVAAAGVDLGDGVAVVLVGVRDPFQDRFEDVHAANLHRASAHDLHNLSRRPPRHAHKVTAMTGQRRVLVVEDDITIAESVAARLRAEGFVVAVAHDGPSGVTRRIPSTRRPRCGSHNFRSPACRAAERK